MFAGKLASLEAAGYAKDEGLTDHACCGPGQNSGRVDLLIAQLGKEGTKGSELLGEHGADCLDSNISMTDPSASSCQDYMRAVLLNDCPDRICDDIIIVRDNFVKNDFVLLLGPFFYPVSALVIGKAAGAGYGQNGKYKRLGSMGLMFFGTHGNTFLD